MCIAHCVGETAPTSCFRILLCTYQHSVEKDGIWNDISEAYKALASVMVIQVPMSYVATVVPPLNVCEKKTYLHASVIFESSASHQIERSFDRLHDRLRYSTIDFSLKNIFIVFVVLKCGSFRRQPMLRRSLCHSPPFPQNPPTHPPHHSRPVPSRAMPPPLPALSPILPSLGLT